MIFEEIYNNNTRFTNQYYISFCELAKAQNKNHSISDNGQLSNNLRGLAIAHTETQKDRVESTSGCHSIRMIIRVFLRKHLSLAEIIPEQK